VGQEAQNASCPTLSGDQQNVFPSRHLLPPSRQGDYEPLAFSDELELDRLLRFALGEFNAGNRLNYLALATTLASLAFDRRVLFLEKELGAAFLRGKLGDLEVGDIHMRWPSFKVVLPHLLLAIKDADTIRWLTHVNICQIDEPIRCPELIARELDELASRLGPSTNHHRLARLEFRAANSGYIISSGLNEVIGDRPQIVYARITNSTPNHLTNSDDDAEHALLTQLEYLTWNVLAFLSATPFEYQADEIIRRGRKEGDHHVAELLRARFVGASQIRAIRRPRVVASSPNETTSTTGTPHAPHWACGSS
jgi:hypothetical protein